MSSFDAISRPSSPLVRKPAPTRPTIFSRLSASMASERPPTIAPPTSPHSEHDQEMTQETISLAATRRPNIAMTLENTGSVARDHLASERTFLAYVRTSLAIASTGVALVQLFSIAVNSDSTGLSFLPTTRRVQGWAQPLGATMVCLGILVLAIGTTRYFRIQSALINGMYPVARWTSAFITVLLGAVITVVFGVMLSAKR
ncbi:DUF202 domain-containing protein [Mycena indigotica]|uniref:DUF202 domain-containing protein n=1 Tax=Mycena indigotica TaxID=2126181 RepID=A0A8H6WAX4_9AGAR|nr:DUF202 domain-containing protein [Mycena indigotica]KAF7309616.1 DUF202 domain-containing protein [Mycena indigotica]